MPRATNVPFTHVSDTASSLTGGSLTLSASASAASARCSNTATKTARRSIRCWCTRNLPRQGSPQRPQACYFGGYYVIYVNIMKIEVGKNFKKWKKMSGTDALATKRIEKLNDSEKKSC